MRGGKEGRARVEAVGPERIRASLARKTGTVLGRLRREEIPVWVVGGALRDALLGRSFRDVDLLVRASRERLSSLFPEGVWVGKVIPAFVLGARRGGRGPTLQITLLSSTLEEELARRDFSINALAMRLDGEGEEGIRDPFGGLSDLSAGLLRRPCLLRNPFPEDPVRVMRLLRFAATLGFAVEPETLALARSAEDLLSGVAGERRRHELLALFSGESLGRLSGTFPEDFLGLVLTRSVGIEGLLPVGGGGWGAIFSLILPCSRRDPLFRLWGVFRAANVAEATLVQNLPFSRSEKRRLLLWGRLTGFFESRPRGPFTPSDRSLLVNSDHRETIRRWVARSLPVGERKDFRAWSTGVIRDLTRPWNEVQASLVKENPEGLRVGGDGAGGHVEGDRKGGGCEHRRRPGEPP